MTATLLRILRSIWRSVGALVLLALIVLALAAGVWIGRSPIRAANEEAARTADVQPAAADGAVQEYTCSMHPQVRLRDPKAKCPICFMDLIPVPGDGDEGGPRSLVMSEAAVRLAEVQLMPVTRRFPTGEVRMVGRVDVDETRTASITAWFPGRVERLLVNFTGATVSRGQAVAEIYSPELLAAQAELRQVAATVGAVSGGSDLVRESTEATLDAARERLRLLGLTESQVRDIEGSERPLDRLTVQAPTSGVIVRRSVREGEYVETGGEIYGIADLSQVWVRMEAFESQLSWLRYGQDVTFGSDAFPGETFRGRIAFVDPVLSEETRTVRVRVNAPNPEGRLKPGMFVRAVVRARLAEDGRVISDELAGRWISPVHPEMIEDGPGTCPISGLPLVRAEELGYVTDLSEVEPPLVVPASATLITGKRAVVYVRTPGAEKPTFEGREVVLGPRAGDWYVVREGLAEGEEVVVNGAFKIDSAMQIAAKPSMMDPKGTGAMPGHQHGAAGTTGPVGNRPHREPGRLDVPEEFLFSLKPVYGAYFDAQEALAADDLARFRTAAGDLHRALDLVRTTGVVGEPLGLWRRVEGRLRKDAEHVEHLDIAGARRLFDTWSKGVIEMESRFGHLGQAPYFRAYCPMAFGEQPAEWLQRGEQIVNPYMGLAMLRCGEVRERFEPRGEREVVR